jgi:hypothetical protein
MLQDLVRMLDGAFFVVRVIWISYTHCWFTLVILIFCATIFALFTTRRTIEATLQTYKRSVALPMCMVYCCNSRMAQTLCF